MLSDPSKCTAGVRCWCWVLSLLTAHISRRSMITYVWPEHYFKTSWQIKLLQIKLLQSYAFQKALFRALSWFCTIISLYRIQTWISGWERDAMGELVNLAWLSKILKKKECYTMEINLKVHSSIRVCIILGTRCVNMWFLPKDFSFKVCSHINSLIVFNKWN